MDIVACTVAHLRTLTDLATLLGNANRINREFISDARILTPELPQIYVVTAAGADTSALASRRRVNIWVESKKANVCSLAHDLIWAAFHEKSYYTLGAGGNTVYCTHSRRNAPPDIERREENSAFEAQAFYDFNVIES
jgi:hypothetical protein